MKNFSVLGVRIAAIQTPSLVAQMEEWIRLRTACNIVVFANVHVVTESHHDGRFREMLLNSLNVPDSKPLVWLGRKHGYELRNRVYGPDLLVHFCRETATKGYRHFFYGGAPGVVQRLATNLERRFRGNIIAGVYTPPFRSLSFQENAEHVEMINSSRPDILWLGLGCPKQEKWAFHNRGTLRVPVVAAVGQAFDIHSGRTRQAPRWMGDNGLEWLFRLCTDPKRLWKRYLFRNSEFLLRLAVEKLRTTTLKQE